MLDTYVALDLETTGVNPKRDKIIEIGAVKVVCGKVEDTFSSFVNPGRRLEERITELTGIRDEMLIPAPQQEKIIPEILAFTEGYVLLGHNILFDYSFLKKAAVNQSLTFERKGIDTLKIARKRLPQLESRRLEFLCEYFQISHEAHRALADAKAANELYRKLAELRGEEKDFEPQTLIYRAKKEVPATKPQKERLYKLLEKHRITIDEQIEALTKNEASRITDQILAAYGR